VTRVLDALDEALRQVESALDSELDGAAMADALREAAEPLDRVVGEATRGAHLLRDQLTDESSMTPLVDRLLRDATALTDRYAIPTTPILRGEWKLPPGISTSEVPFRATVTAFIETTVTRSLLDLTRGLAGDVQELVAALEEFDRVVSFNVELAGGELDVLRDEPVPPATRELVAEMVVGALGRSRARLTELQANSDEWATAAGVGVRTAVLDGLESLRDQITSGKVSELRVRIVREAAAGRRIVEQAGGMTGIARMVSARASAMVTQALGPRRLAALRTSIGMPVPKTHRSIDVEALEKLSDHIELPLVYRRLFSDQALEAGDLLTGRGDAIARARYALSPATYAGLRTVAVVGPAGIGKGSVVKALTRTMAAPQVTTIAPTAPLTCEEVAAWFDDSVGNVYVLDGLRYLFSMTPRGFAPLRRFCEGVVTDNGRNMWIVSTDASVWAFARNAAPLEDAFPEVVRLQALSISELETALTARHAMSGYTLHFEPPIDVRWQLADLFSRTSDVQERRRQLWFKSLHEACGGLVRDALHLWMASITDVDEAKGVVTVGPVRDVPHRHLEALPRPVLLTLRQLMQQGWMDAESLGFVFRKDEVEAEAHLAHLAHLGLLERDEGRYQVAEHLRGATWRVMTDRRWTE
jgi:hypothetical protein